MNAIDIRGLTKRYKQRVAVDGLSLTIEQGEFFALLGQNGAGKTTTIKMLCCLTKPDGGDALLMGNSILTEPLKVKQLIGVSPQETAVAARLSVRENLELIARFHGLDTANAAEKAKRLMEEFQLSDRQNDRAKALSGGLMRRLSIAMALISQPQILFLDEPTLGLDVRARRELWEHIGKLKGKVTVILTTHYLEEAERLSDRVAIMNQGRIAALGSAAEITAQSGKASFEDAFLAMTQEV